MTAQWLRYMFAALTLIFCSSQFMIGRTIACPPMAPIASPYPEPRMAWHPHPDRTAEGSDTADADSIASPRRMAAADGPDGKVLASTLEFGNVPLTHSAFKTITITSNGTQPLRIDYGLTRTPYFWVVTGLPLTTDTTIKIVVAFKPNKLGRFKDTLNFTWDGITPATPVILSGTGTVPNVALPADVDFGNVPFGSCVDTLISMHNLETVQLAITHLTLDAPSAFSMLNADDITNIQADSIQKIHVRFCGSDLGTVSGTMDVEFDGASDRSVHLHAYVIPPTLVIDTATTVPGEIAHLHVKVNGITKTDASTSIGRYTIRLSVAPNALFPGGVGSADDQAHCGISHNKGSITVTSNGPSRIGTDGQLFTIDLWGLSTGTAVNYVSIDSAYVEGMGNITAGNRGIVYLDGCDIGIPVVVGAKLAIRSLRADAEGNLIIRYDGPSGVETRLRLSDLIGGGVAEMALPPATSDEQTVTVPTDLRARGIYLVEIHAGENRATAVVPFGGR